MVFYDPQNWFWLADDGRLYSGARRAEVSADDSDFATWKASGGLPTVWPKDLDGKQTQSALDEVLRSGAPPVTTSKADLYRRATDEEAEKIEAALVAAPVRQRRLFEAALYIDHADPEFASMHAALVDLFGKDRADTLLSPS